MEFKLGELFSGPGGLGLGAKQAKIYTKTACFSIKHEWAIDYDMDSCHTYIKNICPQSPQSVFCQDVRTLDFSLLSSIDALAFGFPCNDFSIVGKQAGFSGEFGPLYSYGVKALNLFQPPWFLAENVEGLSISDQGQTLKLILEELRSVGYHLTVNSYHFEDYGIPQARHRIVIVGIRSDLNLLFRVPKAGHPPTSCRSALENPPIPHNIANHDFTRQSHQVIERLKYIKPGENAWTAHLPPHLQLNVKGAKLSHIYKRLEPDKPSYTVTGSGGGGTHVYHWSEHRALTNRERARLQTFPDEFVFLGSKESVRRQIGMAVPVEGARIIFEAILKTFAKIPYESQKPSIGTFPSVHSLVLETNRPFTKAKSSQKLSLNSVQLSLSLYDDVESN